MFKIDREGPVGFEINLIEGRLLVEGRNFGDDLFILSGLHCCL